MCAVLVCVVNREYMERFWTQLEAWYSFRKGTEEGLISTRKEHLRNTVACVNEQDAMFKDDVANRWADCDVERADYGVLDRRPERRQDVARDALRAVLGGSLASFQTGAVAGLVLG